jgi:hypothetical protein
VFIKKFHGKTKGQSASVTAYLRSAESVLKEWHTANTSAQTLLSWFNVFLLIAHFIAACYKTVRTCSKKRLVSLMEAKRTTGEQVKNHEEYYLLGCDAV